MFPLGLSTAPLTIYPVAVVENRFMCAYMYRTCASLDPKYNCLLSTFPMVTESVASYVERKLAVSNLLRTRIHLDCPLNYKKCYGNYPLYHGYVSI